MRSPSKKSSTHSIGVYSICSWRCLLIYQSMLITANGYWQCSHVHHVIIIMFSIKTVVFIVAARVCVCEVWLRRPENIRSELPLWVSQEMTRNFSAHSDTRFHSHAHEPHDPRTVNDIYINSKVSFNFEYVQFSASARTALLLGSTSSHKCGGCHTIQVF